MGLKEDIVGLAQGCVVAIGERYPQPEPLQPREARLARSLMLDMEEIARNAVLFEFVNVTADEALLEFGGELAKNAMLKLPYRDCIFTFRDLQFGPNTPRIKTAHAVLCQMGGTGVDADGLPLRDGMGKSVDSDAVYLGCWLVLEGPGPAGTCIVTKTEKYLTFEAFAQQEALAGAAKWQQPAPHVGRVFVEGGFAKGAVTMALSMAEIGCALLMAKGVKHIVDKPPERVQQRRKREGRPPLPERHTIIVPTALPAERGGGAGGGSHASPRTHWRRGHVRRLGNGKVTMVSPCIVNADGSAIQPRQYVLKQQKEAAE